MSIDPVRLVKQQLAGRRLSYYKCPVCQGRTRSLRGKCANCDPAMDMTTWPTAALVARRDKITEELKRRANELSKVLGEP